MPILGMTFTRMEGTRTRAQPKGEIKINSSPKILSVKEARVTNLGKRAVNVEFEFKTTYTPDIGTLLITGIIVFMPDDTAPVMEHWKKENKLPEEIHLQVLNHLFRRCLLKMANLAEELQLPPPLQLPMVKPNEPQEEKQEKKEEKSEEK